MERGIGEIEEGLSGKEDGLDSENDSIGSGRRKQYAEEDAERGTEENAEREAKEIVENDMEPREKWRSWLSEE